MRENNRLRNSLYEDNRLYREFTLEKYNNTIKELKEKRYENPLYSTMASIATGLAFMYNPVFSHPLAILKIVWISSLPYFTIYSMGRYKIPEELYIDIEYILRNKERLENEKIIFQIVTRGFNVNAVKDSALSVDYWVNRIREKYGIEINYEIWVITEEDSYNNFSDLEINNLRVLYVPENYKTKNNAKYKGRALEFANEIRRNLELDRSNVWIYHQDEETRVGEDTILGILDFIIKNYNSDKSYGDGIITYPINYNNNITSENELRRTGDDFILLSQLYNGDSLFGYHGSHFLCRSDIESKIGFDYDTIVEDYVFSARAGRIKGVLKGFAYEEPPKSIKDMLKQRRRWIIGIWNSLSIKEIKIKYKLASLYSLFSWYSALPSIAILIQNIFYNTGDIFLFFGFLTGFIWYNILDVYRTGYKINKRYLGKENSLISRIKNVILGFLVEAFAPWCALFSKKPKTFEVIKKS